MLRQDNADLRLTPLGYEIGLISEERYQSFLTKKQQIEEEIERLYSVTLSPTAEIQNYLESIGSTPLKSGIKMAELLKRPQVSYSDLAVFDVNRPQLSAQVCEQAEISIKYEGYIKRQMVQAEQFKNPVQR